MAVREWPWLQQEEVTQGGGESPAVPPPPHQLYSPRLLPAAAGTAREPSQPEGQAGGAGGTEGPGVQHSPLSKRKQIKKNARLRVGEGLGAPMPSATPQPEELDVRSGLGRKAATLPRWRPRPSTRACPTPVPLPHAHSSSESAFHSPSATARPRRIPSPSEDPHPHPRPAASAEVTAGLSRGGQWGFSTDHTTPRRPSPPRERHLPGLAGRAGRALRGPGRWRPRAVRARPATGGMTPSFLELGPAAPADRPLRPLPLQLLPEGIQGQPAMATVSGRCVLGAEVAGWGWGSTRHWTLRWWLCPQEAGTASTGRTATPDMTPCGAS